MSKKNDIILVSLKLFNQYGVQNITTNHICREMKISPGHLYYYYANKEAIIRDIYNQMIQLMDEVWIDNPTQGAEMMFLILNKLNELKTEYIFFYRDIVTLLNNDPQLMQIYIENRDRRFSHMKDTYYRLEKQKLLKLPSSSEGKQMLFEHVWFISEFWLIHKDLNASENHYDYSIPILLNILKSVCTKKGLSILESLFPEWMK